MIRSTYKRAMTSDELHDYFKNWANPFKLQRNTLCNSNITFHVADGDKQILYVYGNNHINIGEFVPDNGCIWGDHGIYTYYPILNFRNKLNYIGVNYNCGVPNTTRIEVTEQGICIDEEALLKCIRDSYSYVKIFEDK